MSGPGVGIGGGVGTGPGVGSTGSGAGPGGSGSGAYAVPLALAGYTVHVVDAMPLHVEQCRQAAAAAETTLGSAVVGDARALELETGGADAGLLFGPLYHLLEPAERSAALTEARRG